MTVSRARLARLEARRGRLVPSLDVDKFFADLFRAPGQSPTPRRTSGPAKPFDAEKFFTDLFRASE